MTLRKQPYAKSDPFPFPFLAHGPWNASDYRQSVEWLVVFESAVAAPKQKGIIDSVPAPLTQSSWSGDRVLTLSTGQDAGEGIWNTYSGQVLLSDKALEAGEFENAKITAGHIQAFSDDVDLWVLNLHKSETMGLVVGNTDKKDKWHRWSVKQFPDRILRMFEDIFKGARPRSDKTKADESIESMMAYALMSAVKDYFSSYELRDAASDLIARLEVLFEHAAGIDDLADRSIMYLRRCIQEERKALRYRSIGNPSLQAENHRRRHSLGAY
jgi:hypothetical protein